MSGAVPGVERAGGRARTNALQLLAAAVLGLASPARAHDPYTSWADVWLRGAQLEVTFTLSRSSALLLLPDSAPLPPITPGNFPDYAPRLKAVAPDLFAITIAGRPLSLTRAETAVSGDDDVVFRLAYALPQTPGGALRIVAQYLRWVVDGHVGTIVVMNADGKDLGWSPVSLDQPMLEVRLDKPRAGKAAPGNAATSK